MAEFSLIERYCQGLGTEHPDTRLSIGDDAAIISVPQGMELAISVDSMVEGVHFSAGLAPADLAHKLIAVNLSDMAAMGALPKWATITLTLPDHDSEWLREFSGSINSMATRFGVELIGGDTTQGPLNVSLQIMGLLPVGKGLRRSGAQVGDDIYISNTVGDAALALHRLQTNVVHGTPSGVDSFLMDALLRPEPQLELGQAMLGLASACIDISDGVVADLRHIARQSQVAMAIEVEKVPLSTAYRDVCGGDYDLALSGGDDYQLAFTAPVSNAELVQATVKQLAVSVTKVGCVMEASNSPNSALNENGFDHLIKLSLNGKPYTLADNAGYQHFTDERS